MSRAETMKKVTEIFRNVLEDESIILADSTTADDIEDWDSLSHIMLISEIEETFDLKLSMKDVVNMKNVGEMLDRIINVYSA